MTNPLKLNIPPKLKRGPKTKQWLGYLEKLRWTSDCQEESIHLAALRGASLGIAEDLFEGALSQVLLREGAKPEPGALLVEFKKAYRYVHQYPLGSFGVKILPLRFTHKPEGTTEPPAITVPEIADPTRFLTARSPYRPDSLDAQDFMGKLYSKNDFLFLLENVSEPYDFYNPVWKPRSLLQQDLTGEFYLLINPVDLSRCPQLSNDKPIPPEEFVAEYRFVALAYPMGDFVSWLSVLARAPIAVVALYRCLDAIVRVDAIDKADWHRKVKAIKAWLICAGLDPARLEAGQIACIPEMNPCSDQTDLLYLAPQADGTPIVDLLPRSAEEDFIQQAQVLLKSDQPISLDKIVKLREALVPLRDDLRVEQLLAQIDGLYF